MFSAGQGLHRAANSLCPKPSLCPWGLHITYSWMYFSLPCLYSKNTAILGLINFCLDHCISHETAISISTCSPLPIPSFYAVTKVILHFSRCVHVSLWNKTLWCLALLMAMVLKRETTLSKQNLRVILGEVLLSELELMISVLVLCPADWNTATWLKEPHSLKPWLLLLPRALTTPSVLKDWREWRLFIVALKEEIYKWKQQLWSFYNNLTLPWHLSSGSLGLSLAILDFSSKSYQYMVG